MNHFANKVAIVTGGASGIGKAICVYLAQHGAQVVVADRDMAGAQEVARQIAARGGCARAARVDVAHAQEVEALVGGAADEYGRLDYLFNNAGISVNGEFQDVSLEQWQSIIEVNLWGVIYGCRAAYPLMQKQGYGHIVNTASLGGLIPGALTAAYSASKHAVVGLTLTLRAEARLYGVKVSALCPGYMRTNIQQTAPTVSAYMDSEKNRALNARMNFPTPDECIEQIMRGVRRNRAIIIAPGQHRVYWWLYRLFPGLLPVASAQIIRTMKRNA
jgi:NAD(P)-dependent dehydrogenase (short-subunit alcohol dehydrogenase family)